MLKTKLYKTWRTKCAKNPRVAIDVIELLQSRDGERDEVTAPGMLLKRNIRDDKMNQRVGGDDKEHYDRSEPSTKLEKTRSVCGKSFVHINIVFSGDDRSTSLSLSSFSNKIKNHGFSDFLYREKAVFVLERKKENKIKYCGIHLVSRMDLVSL